MIQKVRSTDYKKHKLSFLIYIAMLLSVFFVAAILLLLIGYILIKGIPNITPELFSWNYSNENMSMMPALINTLLIAGLTLLISVPIGICSAIYLVEYAKKGSKAVKVIRVTTETLQGIPSIVYGLFGFLIFVIAFKWGYSYMAGVLTLSIMVLPLIIRTSEEALLSVLDSFREGSYGLGAGKLRTIFFIVLPNAVSGILSGIILAAGRIIGETAALIFTAGTAAKIPDSIFDSARTLSVHMYALLSEGLYTEQAYATAVVILLLVITINASASYFAKKCSSREGM